MKLFKSDMEEYDYRLVKDNRPMGVMAAHFVIDFWKIKQGKRVRSFNEQQQNVQHKKTDTVHFFLDQLFHGIIQKFG